MLWRAVKYLIIYPFLPLTIAKCLNLFLLIESVAIWQLSELHRYSSFIAFLIPLSDLLAVGLLLISLWFTAQKFYWRRVELTFDVIGLLCNLVAIFAVFRNDFTHGILYNVLFNHLLSFITWIFIVWWAALKTWNTVSNLFISEWGNGTEEHEIEALQEDF
ncbi:unnamed protein product, partial [Mesorhabditis spiculigera]